MSQPQTLPPPTVKPVISPIQSVLGYLQWQAFEFQMAATHSPTKWYCTPVAPGLLLDDTTGTILGAATMPGVYVFTVQAETLRSSTRTFGVMLPRDLIANI